jgi:hypothetical protein
MGRIYGTFFLNIELTLDLADSNERKKIAGEI